jgi:hypothetical protein
MTKIDPQVLTIALPAESLMLAPVRKWPVFWNTHVPALSAPEAGAAVAVGECGKGDQPSDKQTGCKPPLGADHGAPPKGDSGYVVSVYFRADG